MWGGDVPCATGPICSADGEGGGEGGKLAESSTVKGEKDREKERERPGRQDVDGRKDTMLTGCVCFMSCGSESHDPLGF